MVSHERSIPYPPHSHDEESAHPGASDPGGRGHDSFTCRGQALTSAFSRPAAPAAEACVRRGRLTGPLPRTRFRPIVARTGRLVWHATRFESERERDFHVDDRSSTTPSSSPEVRHALL